MVRPPKQLSLGLFTLPERSRPSALIVRVVGARTTACAEAVSASVARPMAVTNNRAMTITLTGPNSPAWVVVLPIFSFLSSGADGCPSWPTGWLHLLGEGELMLAIVDRVEPPVETNRVVGPRTAIYGVSLPIRRLDLVSSSTAVCGVRAA